MKYCRILWNDVEHSGILYNSVEICYNSIYGGILYNSVDYCSICRIMLNTINTVKNYFDVGECRSLCACRTVQTKENKDNTKYRIDKIARENKMDRVTEPFVLL